MSVTANPVAARARATAAGAEWRRRQHRGWRQTLVLYTGPDGAHWGSIADQVRQSTLTTWTSRAAFRPVC